MAGDLPIDLLPSTQSTDQKRQSLRKWKYLAKTNNANVIEHHVPSIRKEVKEHNILKCGNCHFTLRNVHLNCFMFNSNFQL